MNRNKPLEKFFFDEDENGHWYCIPTKLRKEWAALVHSIHSAEMYSEEFDNLCAEFTDTFGEYRLGGGITHIDFYLEKHPEQV
jgi:hypothetical protein